MSAAEPEAEWKPGDPLYDRSTHPHSLYLFNYRGDPTSETCACNDAASWPEPRSGYDLGPNHDLRGFINEHRAATGLPPLDAHPEPIPIEQPAPPQRGLLTRFLGGG